MPVIGLPVNCVPWAILSLWLKASVALTTIGLDGETDPPLPISRVPPLIVVSARVGVDRGHLQNAVAGDGNAATVPEHRRGHKIAGGRAAQSD